MLNQEIFVIKIKGLIRSFVLKEFKANSKEKEKKKKKKSIGVEIKGPKRTIKHALNLVTREHVYQHNRNQSKLYAKKEKIK